VAPKPVLGIRTGEVRTEHPQPMWMRQPSRWRRSAPTYVAPACATVAPLASLSRSFASNRAGLSTVIW
jgi:hypothetical protein